MGRASTERASLSLSLSLIGIGWDPRRSLTLLDRAKPGGGPEEGIAGEGGNDAAADGGDGGGADDGEGDQGGVRVGGLSQAHPGRTRLQGRLASQVPTPIKT